MFSMYCLIFVEEIDKLWQRRRYLPDTFPGRIIDNSEKRNCFMLTSLTQAVQSYL